MKGWDQSRCGRAAEMAITVAQSRRCRKDGEKKTVLGTLRKGNLQESDGQVRSRDGWEGVNRVKLWFPVCGTGALQVPLAGGWALLWSPRGDVEQVVGDLGLGAQRRYSRGLCWLNNQSVALAESLPAEDAKRDPENEQFEWETAGKCSQRATRGLPGWH